MNNKKEKLNTLPQHVQVPHGLCKGQIDYQILGLYAYLRRYMNKDTYSTFVSLRTLQGETNLSIPTIQKYLSILEEENHIKIIKGEKSVILMYLIKTVLYIIKDLKCIHLNL